MPPPLLDVVRQVAAEAGLNLFGIVDAQRFDACQPREGRAATWVPKCGTIVVLGSGGRAFWQSCRATKAVAAGTVGATEMFVRQVAAQAAARLQRGGVACRVVDAGDTPRLSFPRLGEAAGFGIVSPVSGLLLHPEFGPWLRVRAALLIEGRPFGPIPDASITDRFQPCCGCAQPCVSACPAGVHDGVGHQDLARCASHRRDGGCATSCGSRAACPVGAAHRDGADEQSHRYGFALPALPAGPRWFGLSIRRLLPRWIRGADGGR
jgi:epoxyqueuosine reductase